MKRLQVSLTTLCVCVYGKAKRNAFPKGYKVSVIYLHCRKITLFAYVLELIIHFLYNQCVFLLDLKSDIFQVSPVLFVKILLAILYIDYNFVFI